MQFFFFLFLFPPPKASDKSHDLQSATAIAASWCRLNINQKVGGSALQTRAFKIYWDNKMLKVDS